MKVNEDKIHPHLPPQRYVRHAHSFLLQYMSSFTLELDHSSVCRHEIHEWTSKRKQTTALRKWYYF